MDGRRPSPSPTVAAPLVSVVVPVFDGERFLRESLDSILAQTYSPRELVVVDDGSTDSTAEILASYGDALRTLRQPRNLGIYDTIWSGVEAARGELAAARDALAAIPLRPLLASRRVQRLRLAVLNLGFLVLARLPRIAPVAELLRRRWYPRAT